MHKYFNYLLLSVFLFFCLYVIEITDLLITYEIFIDLLLIPLFISICVFLILTIIQFKKDKKFPESIKLISFVSLIIAFSIIFAQRNGAFYGPIYLKGKFLDDRSRMDLELYQNGKYIVYSNWLFGEERFVGNYKIKNDTIIFGKFPVIDNDFISQKVIIDKAEKKIYFRKNNNGNYDKSFYYFQIED